MKPQLVLTAAAALAKQLRTFSSNDKAEVQKAIAMAESLDSFVLKFTDPKE